MPPQVTVDADLAISSLDGTRGTLRGSGSDLTFTLEALGERGDARRRLGSIADGLNTAGIRVAVVDVEGRELARLGRGVESRIGRALLGSASIHVTRHLARFVRSFP